MPDAQSISEEEHLRKIENALLVIGGIYGFIWIFITVLYNLLDNIPLIVDLSFIWYVILFSMLFYLTTKELLDRYVQLDTENGWMYVKNSIHSFVLILLGVVTGLAYMTIELTTTFFFPVYTYLLSLPFLVMIYTIFVEAILQSIYNQYSSDL